MTNFIRSDRSRSDWTLNDLNSYHISLEQVDPLLFFGLRVGENSFSIAPLTTFHLTGAAATLS